MTPDVPWWEMASCLGMAPLFDAVESDRQRKFDRAQRKDNAERVERAAKVCATCPVARQCELDAKPGRDEGIRAGKVLPPIFGNPERRQQGAA